MKKNVMMRMACFLLVAVLISTSAISGTYAKYVTANTATDSARVAKFGVEITNESKMFSDSYKEYATIYTNPDTDNTITVQADTEGTNVVAPGTKGGLTNFVVEGKPEVDVEVTYADADLVLTGWTVDGKYYCPIVITVNGEKISGLDYSDIASFEAAVEAKIKAANAIYQTNTDLSTVNDDLIVTWEWPFSTSAENDVKDTSLGDQAAGLNGGVASTIKLTVTCTITQVD